MRSQEQDHSATLEVTDYVICSATPASHCMTCSYKFMPQENHNYVVDPQINKTESKIQAVSRVGAHTWEDMTDRESSEHINTEMWLVWKCDLELPDSQKGGGGGVFRSSLILGMENGALLQTLKDRWKWTKGTCIQTSQKGRFWPLQQAGPPPSRGAGPKQGRWWLGEEETQEQLTLRGKNKVSFWTTSDYTRTQDLRI